MAQSEVPFNEIGRGTRPERPERRRPNGLPIDAATAWERGQQKTYQRELETYQRELKSYEEIVAGCQTTFDAIHGASAGDTAWVAWEEDRLLYEEMANLNPLQILEDEEERLFTSFQQEIQSLGYPDPFDFRTLSVYEFESAGRKRRVCLIFGEEGLVHIFLLATDFRDVWDEIRESIDNNPSYEGYSSWHVSAQPNRAYEVFVERRYSIDRGDRVLVSFKDSEMAVGAWARAQAFIASEDFFDGNLPSFLSYTDLIRRARIFKTYRERTLPALRQALRDAVVAARAVQERKTAIERAKEQKQRSETQQLLDAFR